MFTIYLKKNKTLIKKKLFTRLKNKNKKMLGSSSSASFMLLFSRYKFDQRFLKGATFKE